jgi:uncharacterized Tic20 family protein
MSIARTLRFVKLLALSACALVALGAALVAVFLALYYILGELAFGVAPLVLLVSVAVQAWKESAKQP